jgi:hypothetical protein
VTESVHQRVAELLAHHVRRLELTEDQALRWTRRERELVTLDPLNRMLAVMETKAHLDVLVHGGSVDRRLEGGLLRYSAHAVSSSPRQADAAARSG